MGNEESWNTFVRTGSVTDYLAYARSENRNQNTANRENEKQEVRRQSERTCDGNRALGSYHW